MVSTGTSATPLHPGNANQPWDLFDSDAYLKQHYRTLAALDRLIMRQLGRFLESVCRGRTDLDGLDVGSGTNLYPSLAQVPFTKSITFWEHSASNVDWLQNMVKVGGPSWGPQWQDFWAQLTESSAAYAGHDPEPALKERAQWPVQANVFDLPEARFDLATMFFVAESITGLTSEFELATQRFVRAVKPGGGFAAAFMEQSHGYQVGSRRFPAVNISERDIVRALRGVADDVKIHTFRPQEKVRKGYRGALLATGIRVAADTTGLGVVRTTAKKQLARAGRIAC